MGVIIAIVNNKGGVGKTTITTNLAHALANSMKGKQQVLVVDADAQANTSSFFFRGNIDWVPSPNLHDLLWDDGVDVRQCIHAALEYERISVLPAIPDLAALEPEMLKRSDTGLPLLRDKLRDYAKSKFGVTLIDCPPNLGTFVMQAMVAADYVVVPLESGSKFSIDGIAKTVQLISDIRSVGQNTNLSLLRFLLNKAKPRTLASKISHEHMRERFPGLIFETVLSESTDIKISEFESNTVLRSKSGSMLSRQFRELAKEVLALPQLANLNDPEAND
jgi:cellulose biosynthesis protein BcsQ